MKERLAQLEQSARRLEPDADTRASVRKPVVEYSEAFLNDVHSLKAFAVSSDKGVGLLDSPISEGGIGIDAAIELIRDNVDTPGLNPASHGHLAYIPGGGIYYAALGDYLADVFNRYAGFSMLRRARCEWRICLFAGCVILSDTDLDRTAT